MSPARRTHVCTTIAAALALGLTLPTLASAQSRRISAAETDAAFAAAAGEYRGQHFAAAYGRFMRLADLGNVEAAMIAWTMYCNGKGLFGTEWYASPQQLRAWASLVTEDAHGGTVAAPADD
jgi:hypothetical protein